MFALEVTEECCSRNAYPVQNEIDYHPHPPIVCITHLDYICICKTKINIRLWLTSPLSVNVQDHHLWSTGSKFPNRVWWRPSWLAVWVIIYSFERWQPNDHCFFVGSNWLSGFRQQNTMFYATWSSVGWQSGSSNTILKEDLLSIIAAKYGPNWTNGF